MLRTGRLILSARQLKQFVELSEAVCLNTNKLCARQYNGLPKSCKNKIQRNWEKCSKSLHTTSVVALKNVKNDDVEDKALLAFTEFDNAKEKNKKTFLEAVRIYEQNFGTKKGHVDFIKIALRNMKEFGVHKDIEVYKRILDVLPKGPLIVTNVFLADALYHPRQQIVACELLDQISVNAIFPDAELGTMLQNIFGKLSMPYKKYAQMKYWAVKFQNRSPWPLPRPAPEDPFLLGKLAIQRITSVDIETEISIFDTTEIEDSIDKTWIVSGQSPVQKELLTKHNPDTPVIVEGGDIIWLRDRAVAYFILKADSEPLPYTPPSDLNDLSLMKSPYFNPNYREEDEITPSVHEQDDGLIYGVCATGTSSKDSLLSWVRLLQKNGNPVLENVPVLFRFRQPEMSPVVFSDDLVTNNQ